MRNVSRVALLLVVVAICFLAGCNKDHAAAASRKILYYVDPMHPAYKSDKPGIAPDCGMQLEPVYADGGPAGQAENGGGNDVLASGAIHVSPEKQQQIGVELAQAEKTSGNRTVRTLAKVALDETRVFRLTAGSAGLVRTVGPFVNGSIVRKDEILGTFYNREFITAQQAYLFALNTMDRVKTNNESAEQMKSTMAQVQVAEENLEVLGMGEPQIEELGRTRQLVRNIDIVSPVAGIVVARNTYIGVRFDRGVELFRIADISHIWILADVFKSDAQYFIPGTTVKLMLPDSSVSLRATVSNELPQFDPTTRTMKVRLEADNPGLRLRPDMFVDVELPVKLPPGLSVPVDAVLDTGLHKRVFVDRGNGVFEPREVETGWRSGGRIEILRGLTPGARVVASATFLMDSESRLKAASTGSDASTVKDPVCGMTADESKAKAEGNTSSYRGTTYSFCSKSCKDKFEKEPEKYLAPGRQASGQ
jgi:RND family efflux transporter MFP subunit